MKTTVNIQELNHYELKLHCTKAKISMGTFVEQAVKEKMEREPIDRTM